MKKKITIMTFIFASLLLGCKKDKIKFVRDIIVNDTLISKGYMKGSLKTGFWKYYDFNGNLLVVNEYKVINNKKYSNESIDYLNQEIVFDKHGDTIFGKSTFYNCKITSINKDSLLLEINYEGLSKDTPYIMLVYNDSINADFSNINKLTLDTLFFYNNKLHVQLPKNKILRGIINEIVLLQEGMDIREVYFDYNEDYQDISEIR